MNRSSFVAFASLFLAASSASAQVPLGEREAFERRITPEVRVVQSAAPTVVYVETNVLVRQQTWWGGVVEGMQRSNGSGVVLHEEGYIVTNYHVVRGAEQVTVRFDPAYDERLYDADVLAWVEAEDLALLKIRGGDQFPTVELGTSSDLMVGEKVLAIGNPYGQSFTVSSGIISGLHRNVQAGALEFENLIQTDASINPGNSGGPLLNINGELIGINTAMNTQAENIGFAIPVDRVWQVLQDQLLSPGQWRAWLGYDVAGDDDFRVTKVVDRSPAWIAGLRVGDRLLQIDGKALEDAEDYRFARLAVQPHVPAEFQVERSPGAAPRALTLRAWERTDGILFERMGIRLEPVVVNPRIRTVRVVDVRPDGPADQLGIRPDDIIEAVRPTDGRPSILRSPDQLAVLVVGLEPGVELAMDIWRDDDGNGRYERNDEYSELYKGTLELQ